MLCARTRADGSHGCRTRASAGGGRGAAGTGGHHGYNSSNIEIYYRHALYLLWKRLSPYALVLLLLFLPRYAYAAPSLEVDGNFAGYEDGEEYKGYVVVDSPDNYQSTLCLIGEWSKLIQITTEQYETLSNPSTGGAFYELSQQWRKIGHNASFTEEYYPQWMALSKDYADGLVTVYGYGRVWAAVCTDDLLVQAKQDFNTIIDGGTVGGGTTEPEEPEDDGTYVYIDWSETVTAGYTSNTSGLCVKKTVYENTISTLKQNLSDGHLFVGVGFSGANRFCAIFSWCTDKPNITANLITYVGSGKYTNRVTEQMINTRIFNGKTYAQISDTYFQRLDGSVEDATEYRDWLLKNVGAYYWGDTSTGGGSGGEPVEPSPDPWEPPTTPDTPTNPTTPTPKDPITPNPPTLPGTPTDPTIPAPPQSPTVDDGGTFTVDLQGILDALDEHCIHIQTCLNSNFSGQNSYLGELFSTYTAAIVDQIYNGDVSKIGAIGDVNNTIAQGFSDIFEYWDDYTEWLDKKLDFKIPESDPYDDTDLLNWLRKIYVRQGTGDVNTRPVDPATNYGGMTKWLGVLYGEITGDVSDTSITALSTSLNALQHTFPFSLPWDIQQILQALDATPVTPAASITVPALAGAWDAYSYDIDLHWLDSSMVAVRGFELLAFVLYCLVHTKEVFGYVVGD